MDTNADLPSTSDVPDAQITRIDSKIVNYSVVDKTAPTPPPAEPTPPPVIVPAKPHTRPDVVVGSTYRIRPPTMGSALYITINDIVLADGTRRPIEIFVNTKNTEHYQWVVALTRVISALFRKPGEFLFLIDELQQVFDPTGGYWEGAKMMPSVVAHIGAVLKQHCRDLGLIDKPVLDEAAKVVIEEKRVIAEAKGVKGTLCTKCSEMKVVLLDGCMTCLNCWDSKCQ
jgi:hypothetical protein